mmetsp:Transcript_110772/g.352923  ORF Transcript_110772/g.352923 Transcript_110772/m.352923 type:complete len:86 (+) Transcript_110772:39-296(+)
MLLVATKRTNFKSDAVRPIYTYVHMGVPANMQTSDDGGSQVPAMTSVRTRQLQLSAPWKTPLSEKDNKVALIKGVALKQHLAHRV